MQVDTMMLDDGATIYYDDDFRRVLEDHMTFLRTLPSTKAIAIDPARAFKYEFDLYGLCNDYNIPMQFHWLIMRLNNYTAPTEFSGLIDNLLVPDFTVIEQLRQSHMTTRKLA